MINGKIFRRKIFNNLNTMNSVVKTFLILTSISLSFQKDNFDFITFSQNWPVSMCIKWNNSHRKCDMTHKNIWITHGVWPTRENARSPQYCSKRYSREELFPILEDLTEYWRNLRNSESDSLWNHEWTKHGTCFHNFEPLNSEEKYFSMGLFWLNRYPMLKILSNAGITPSNEQYYSLPDINYAIKNKIGVNPIILCEFVNGKSYVSEVKFCFNKNLEISNCGFKHGGNIRSNCHNYVIYPSSVENVD